MSFYSYKNANPRNCPCAINGDALNGLPGWIENGEGPDHFPGIGQQRPELHALRLVLLRFLPGIFEE